MALDSGCTKGYAASVYVMCLGEDGTGHLKPDVMAPSNGHGKEGLFSSGPGRLLSTLTFSRDA